jgi:hypothetical protein
MDEQGARIDIIEPLEEGYYGCFPTPRGTYDPYTLPTTDLEVYAAKDLLRSCWIGKADVFELNGNLALAWGGFGTGGRVYRRA